MRCSAAMEMEMELKKHGLNIGRDDRKVRNKIKIKIKRFK